MLIVYSNTEAGFVTTPENEAAFLEEYFASGSGRDVEDFDREVANHSVELYSNFKVSCD